LTTSSFLAKYLGEKSRREFYISYYAVILIGGTVMKKTVTLVKFMTKEELVNMLIQIKNFINPVTKKRHHCYRTADQCLDDKWHRAKYKFNMNNLDYVDALIYEEGGYVRYTTWCKEVIDMLKTEFGFEEE
jgi:hypothetical protein